ncbi:hypothetical protein HDU96_009473 [Phlyctochytrium bullatum]|nr:hypothetical protein HDU96_009473 [Phlyctochytrium bullatum]
MPRLQLNPLPAYAHAYTRPIERSLAPAPSAHLDNAALVTILSDAQQRFYDRLFPRARALGSGPIETVNGDLQVRYAATAHRFDVLNIEVGVESVARVAFRMGFRVTMARGAEEERTEAHLTPIVEKMKGGKGVVLESASRLPVEAGKLVAVAEIGVVRTGEDGRPCELGDAMKKALEEVLEDQRALVALAEAGAKGDENKL